LDRLTAVAPLSTVVSNRGARHKRLLALGRLDEAIAEYERSALLLS
jgi:hypothetical protein